MSTIPSRPFAEMLADRLQAVGPDEFPRGYYEHLAREREHELRGQLAAAYHEAMQAGHASACVAIHVGQEVWDYLRSLTTHDVEREQVWTPPTVGLMWGFPLILEDGEHARPEHISIRTTKVIA